MKKSGLIKLISLIIALAIIIGLLYWLSDGFTERNVKKWSFKRSAAALSSSAYITEINADKLRDMEVIYLNEKEETNQTQAR